MPGLVAARMCSGAFAVVISIVFLWQLMIGQDIATRAIYAFGTIPALISGRAGINPELAVIFAPLRLVTGLFLHASAIGVALNVLALAVYGYLVESSCGRGRSALLLVVGGVFYMLTVCVMRPDSIAPTVGFDGAIMALFGAAWVLGSAPVSSTSAIVSVLIKDRARIAAGALTWLLTGQAFTISSNDLAALGVALLIGGVLALILKPTDRSLVT